MEIPNEVIERAIDASRETPVYRYMAAERAHAKVIAEWTRKTIADQVRRNCTPSSEAYAAGGDALIAAVADWIENPPEWVGAAA